MASLMTMNFTEFVTDFLKNYDYTKFDFIIVSKELCGSVGEDSRTLSSKYDNIDFANDLYPLPAALGFSYEGKFDRFAEAYMTQLDNMFSKISTDIWAIVDLIVNHNSDIVLLCSETESKLKYLPLLVEYIAENYKVPGVSYEDFKKFGGYNETFDKPEVQKRLDFRKDMLEQEEETIVFNRFTESIRDKFREILMQKDIHQLRDFCKSKGLFVKRSYGVEETVEYILDKLYGDIN